MTFPLVHTEINLFDCSHAGLPVFRSAGDTVRKIGDEAPIQCLYPEIIRKTAHNFLARFPGDILYAVKCNPHPAVLSYLVEAGIRHFDVASVAEIEAVQAIMPEAALYFMHPIKSRKAIRFAYDRGVRDFAIDSDVELDKIVEETDGAPDLNLYVRIALARGAVEYDLSGKFGIAGPAAVELIARARSRARTLGVSFHVGSQCMSPLAYRNAIGVVRDLVDAADVTIDRLDVGGGFPVNYPGMTPPPLGFFMDEIKRAAELYGFGSLHLMCEPGRAMVAEGGSVLVRVEQRRGNVLYLNDGTYGALFDAGTPRWRFPVQLLRQGGGSKNMAPFSFFGPTCDSLDKMDGPFYLPDDVREGDWIEVRQLGAYGAVMRTNFNGFYTDVTVAVSENNLGSRNPFARQDGQDQIKLEF